MSRPAQEPPPTALLRRLAGRPRSGGRRQRLVVLGSLELLPANEAEHRVGQRILRFDCAQGLTLPGGSNRPDRVRPPLGGESASAGAAAGGAGLDSELVGAGGAASACSSGGGTRTCKSRPDQSCSGPLANPRQARSLAGDRGPRPQGALDAVLRGSCLRSAASQSASKNVQPTRAGSLAKPRNGARAVFAESQLEGTL